MKYIRIIRLVLACLLIVFIALSKAKSSNNTSPETDVAVSMN